MESGPVDFGEDKPRWKISSSAILPIVEGHYTPQGIACLPAAAAELEYPMMQL